MQRTGLLVRSLAPARRWDGYIHESKVLQWKSFTSLRDSTGSPGENSNSKTTKRSKWMWGGLGLGAMIGGSLVYLKAKSRLGDASTEALTERPDPKVLKRMNQESRSDGLKITLYQYVTCPFCCKVRAYLDYYGIRYDIVEVNSVSKKEVKWSRYKKVPTICIEGKNTKDFVQVNESTVITSLLHSHAIQQGKKSVSQLLPFYPTLESKDGKKTVYDFPNKYFLMFEDVRAGMSTARLREEREWREWADAVLVHALSPNVYQSLGESLQSFRVFEKRGEWEKVFSPTEKASVVYVGAFVMWLLGKKLKRKYGLKDDPRQSLYEYCDEWVAAIGPHREFMGGASPNLADLAVYGVLTSIEGCQAFDDNMTHSSIGPWYRRMQKAVVEHQGAHSKPIHLGPSS